MPLPWSAFLHIMPWHDADDSPINEGLMKRLIQTLLRIMMLSAGPQDLPYSPAVLLMTLVAYVITGLVILAPGTDGFSTTLLLMAMDVIVLTGFCYFLLYTRSRLPRLLQTITAMAGVGVLFQLLAYPLILMLDNNAASQQGSAVGSLLYFVLISWQLAAVAHIFKQALDMAIGLTLMLSVAYLLLVIFLSDQILTMAA